MNSRRLDGLDVFADVEPDTLERVSQVLVEAVYGDGNVIVTQEQPPESVFIVLEGDVRVTRTLPTGQSVGLCTLGPGSLFGALSALDGRPRGASCIARGRAVVGEIPKEEFLALMNGDGVISVRFQFAVVRALFRDLRVANQRLAELGGADEEDVGLVAVDDLVESA